MAKLAATESLTTILAVDLPTLFNTTGEDVRYALGKLAAPDRFARLSRDFFARLVNRSLEYFTSRAIADHIGPDRSLPSIGDYADFRQALAQGSHPHFQVGCLLAAAMPRYVGPTRSCFSLAGSIRWQVPLRSYPKATIGSCWQAIDRLIRFSAGRRLSRLHYPTDSLAVFSTFQWKSPCAQSCATSNSRSEPAPFFFPPSGASLPR
jgi:hypothetical protein